MCLAASAHLHLHCEFMSKPVWRHLAAAASPSSAFHYSPGRKMCLFVLTMHDVIFQTGYIAGAAQLSAALTFPSWDWHHSSNDSLRLGPRKDGGGIELLAPALMASAPLPFGSVHER